MESTVLCKELLMEILLLLMVKVLDFLVYNSPERGEPYYAEAKEFLNERILNKTVRLEFGKDKYDRYNRKTSLSISK